MTVIGNIQLGFSLEETIAAANSPAQSSASRLRYSQYNKNFRLDSTTLPALDVRPVDLSKTLASAQESMDLTAIPWLGDNTVTLDMTGNKLLGILLQASSGNDAGGVTVRPHATNGYDLFGAGNDHLLLPGEIVALCFQTVASTKDAVGVADKVIEYSGTIGDIITGQAIFSS